MKTVLTLSGLLIGLILFGCTLLWLPRWMANQYKFRDPPDLAWATQVNANRTLLVNLAGGVVVALTIYFTYRNFKIAQDKSLTDLLSKGVEQLGNADLSVRLGGIHSLARIAQASESDYFPIMQLLAGHLRTKYGRANGNEAKRAETSPGPSACPVEVQSILAIIGERYRKNPTDYDLDLSYVDVSDAWVPRADFQNIFFWNVKLTRWNFESAKLNSADFKDATLIRCDFTNADLTNTSLAGAKVIEPTGLTETQLKKALNVDGENCRPSA